MENFPKLIRDIGLYIQEPLHTPNRINTRKTQLSTSQTLLKTENKLTIFIYIEKTEIIPPNEHQKDL